MAKPSWTRRAAVSESRIDLPNIDTALFQQPDARRLMAPERATHRSKKGAEAPSLKSDRVRQTM
ncbi:hypothetical protein ALDI51_30720 [Alicycliphilus denitrificans]|nr:hypothetical protein ALDI51_30720 [Alicycliphilus denitrificans]